MSFVCIMYSKNPYKLSFPVSTTLSNLWLTIELLLLNCFWNVIMENILASLPCLCPAHFLSSKIRELTDCPFYHTFCIFLILLASIMFLYRIFFSASSCSMVHHVLLLQYLPTYYRVPYFPRYHSLFHSGKIHFSETQKAFHCLFLCIFRNKLILFPHSPWYSIILSLHLTIYQCHFACDKFCSLVMLLVLLVHP